MVCISIKGHPNEQEWIAFLQGLEDDYQKQQQIK